MDLPKRKPTRLNNYSYSNDGSYFITVCTKDKQKLLCDIVGFGACDEPKIILKSHGLIAEKYINLMNCKYNNLFIDKYVIMPNHIHFLITIQNSENTNGSSQASNPTNEIIPKFISLFKRYCNREYGDNIWQKSYNDHIIRGEKDYMEIWEYIDTNTYRWAVKSERKYEY